MYSNNNKPTILTAQHYDKKITVEFDHSDTDLDEVMDAVETLIIGMGFHSDSLKRWIVDRAEEYNDEDDDILVKFSEKDIDEAFAQHNAEEDADWDVTLNDGLEEEIEFNDYGMRIHNHD